MQVVPEKTLNMRSSKLLTSIIYTENQISCSRTPVLLEFFLKISTKTQFFTETDM